MLACLTSKALRGFFLFSPQLTRIEHNVTLHAPRKPPQRDPARFAVKDALIPGRNAAKRPR